MFDLKLYDNCSPLLLVVVSCYLIGWTWTVSATVILTEEGVVLVLGEWGVEGDTEVIELSEFEFWDDEFDEFTVFACDTVFNEGFKMKESITSVSSSYLYIVYRHGIWVY